METKFKGKRSDKKNSKSKARNAVRRADRRKAAEARQAASDKLTPTQRIAKLDRKLGSGRGAIKERKRLLEKSSVGA